LTSTLPYRLVRPLGVGGYAEVFEGVRRDRAGDPVALKRGLGQTKEGAARLRREIKVQRELDHPNVMPILDADPIGEWYTMPLADSLLRLRKDGKIAMLAQDLALDVIERASQGLGYAHDQGYLHRDVTPGNILG
jgi:serine/threonine protein kinase